MRVRFQRLMCSPTLTAQVGQVVDLPETQAHKRIAAGDAVAVDEPRRSLRQRLAGRKKQSRESDPQVGQRDGAELETRNVAQLKKYAGELGVDLDGATKKAEIIAAIRAAQDDDDQDPDDAPDAGRDAGRGDG